MYTTEQSQFGRSYQFDFLPKGFFGRLMIRMISFPIQVLSYWRYGMLCRMGQEIILLTITRERYIYPLQLPFFKTNKFNIFG